MGFSILSEERFNSILGHYQSSTAGVRGVCAVTVDSLSPGSFPCAVSGITPPLPRQLSAVSVD